jgi:hypothetical protein
MIKTPFASCVDDSPTHRPIRGYKVRFRTTFLVLVASTAAATGALAAPFAKDPSSLILRKSDFPAKADYDSSSGDDIGIGDKLSAARVEWDAAGYLGATYSKKKGFLQVSGVVFTLPSAAEAKKALTIAKKVRDTFWKKFSGPTKPIQVGSYGDRQFARYDPAGGEGIGTIELLVRRNTVMWLLNLKLERRPAAPKAELLADLKKFAAEQKARVGKGT